MSQPIFVAHRGAWLQEDHPQNSMAAVRAAKRFGFQYVEVDVHLSKDGIPVLCHDQIVSGIDACATSYEELPKLSNGELLPKLISLIDWLLKAPSNFQLFVELKPVLDNDINLSLVEACRKICLPAFSRVSFISFSIEMLLQLKFAHQHAVVYYLGGDESPQELKLLGLDGLNYQYSKLIDNPEYFAEAKEIGMHIGAWTVNDLVIARKLISLGINSITTDNSGVLAEYLFCQRTK